MNDIIITFPGVFNIESFLLKFVDEFERNDSTEIEIQGNRLMMYEVDDDYIQSLPEIIDDICLLIFDSYYKFNIETV